MALLTVERSQSIEGLLSSSSEEEESEDGDDKFVDGVDSPKPHPPKLGRMRSPSFAGYFASKGGAVSLPDGSKTRTPTDSNKNPCAELQEHLQSMITLLREEDSLKMAVRIESQLPDKKRYLTAVTNVNGECILIGIDWASGPTIGLVLELSSTTTSKLDGDGGFHITYEESGRTHCFKPVSVQTLWSAMHIIEHGVTMARQKSLGASYTELLNHYKGKIDSDVISISEWNRMDDLMSTTQFDMVTSDQEDSETATLKKVIRAKLKEVMVRVDIDDVTSRQIRQMCESELHMDLSEYKSFLDQEMFTILGQMDIASEIYDYLYLGSEWNASDLEQLQNIGIGHILNLTKEIDNFFPDTFTYYRVRVYDEEDTELLKYWDKTYKFIHNAKMAGSKVLVHCRRGISRSASTVIAYVMKSRGLSLKESMEHVKKCRSIVDPNAGFQKQLIIYEGILNSSRNRYNALFRQRSKSDVLHPSLHERRQQFKRAKYSKEVNEDGSENNDGDLEERITDRPRSWAPESSVADFESSFNSNKFVVSPTTKNQEMPPLQEDVEDFEDVKGAEDAEDNASSLEKGTESDADKREDKEQDGKFSINERAFKSSKSQTRKNHRLLQRARTLPPQYSPRHWEEMGQSEAMVDDSRSLTEAEEKKEGDLLDQAVAASVIKNQLLKSLVKLHELREDDAVDSKFAFESIIKPSSLRKASASKRMPCERTRSFSEERDGRSCLSMRDRAFTIGPTTYFPPNDDDDIEAEEEDTERDKTQSDESKANFEAPKSISSANIDESSSSDPTAIDNTFSNKSESNVIETSEFQTVKESAKWYENQEKLLAQKIRILRSPRRHTIDSSEIFDKVIKESPSSSRSKSSERRPVSRNQSPSPETIGRGRKESADGVSSKTFLTVQSAANGKVLCQDDASCKETGDLKQQGMSDDDLSVRKLVKKHSELIKNSSPPGDVDSSCGFFNTTSLSLIGEKLISTSTDVPPSQSESVEKDVSKVCVVAEEGQGDLTLEATTCSTITAADIVQPGLVKRQSRMFSQLDSGRDLQSPEKSTEASVDIQMENEHNSDEENIMEKGVVQSKKSKGGCVQERLRQMEDKCDVKAQHSASFDSQTHGKDLDTKIASSMHSTKEDADVQCCLQNNLKMSPKNESHVESQLGSRGSPLQSEKNNPRTKSAPVSPLLRREDQLRTYRSSSLGDTTQVHGKYGKDDLVSSFPSDAPTEDVKRLVDRFEVGDLNFPS